MRRPVPRKPQAEGQISFGHVTNASAPLTYLDPSPTSVDRPALCIIVYKVGMMTGIFFLLVISGVVRFSSYVD